MVIVSGVFAAACVVGHFTVGSKSFLQPMLRADFGLVPKRTMHCCFHYVSAFLVLSAVALLGLGFGLITLDGSSFVIRFIAANWAAFAMIQILIVLACRVEKGLIKMFQWVLFLGVAVFGYLGAL